MFVIFDLFLWYWELGLRENEDIHLSPSFLKVYPSESIVPEFNVMHVTGGPMIFQAYIGQAPFSDI